MIAKRRSIQIIGGRIDKIRRNTVQLLILLTCMIMRFNIRFFRWILPPHTPRALSLHRVGKRDKRNGNIQKLTLISSRRKTDTKTSCKHLFLLRHGREIGSRSRRNFEIRITGTKCRSSSRKHDLFQLQRFIDSLTSLILIAKSNVFQGYLIVFRMEAKKHDTNSQRSTSLIDDGPILRLSRLTGKQGGCEHAQAGRGWLLLLRRSEIQLGGTPLRRARHFGKRQLLLHTQ